MSTEREQAQREHGPDGQDWWAAYMRAKHADLPKAVRDVRARLPESLTIIDLTRPTGEQQHADSG